MCNLLYMITWLRDLAYMLISSYCLTMTWEHERGRLMLLTKQSRPGLSFSSIRSFNVRCLSSFATSRKCTLHAAQRVPTCPNSDLHSLAMPCNVSPVISYVGSVVLNNLPRSSKFLGTQLCLLESNSSELEQKVEHLEVQLARQ